MDKIVIAQVDLNEYLSLYIFERIYGFLDCGQDDT